MPKQYFQENPNILTNERELHANILGHDLIFKTNNGLFSPTALDFASLLLINQMPSVSGTFLDFGCGYGLIGIAMARANDISLTMSDVNRIALTYAQKNAARNHIQAQFIHSDSFEHINETFDTIALNPPIHAGKDVMMRMYHDAAKHLTPQGSFFIVIQKKHGADSSIVQLKELFTSVDVIYKKKGFFIIQSGH